MIIVLMYSPRAAKSEYMGQILTNPPPFQVRSFLRFRSLPKKQRCMKVVGLAEYGLVTLIYSVVPRKEKAH